MSLQFGSGSVLLRGAAKPASVIPDSAVHQWPFDEGSGTSLADAIGSADGTLTGATWVSDSSSVGGWRLSFDGIDDEAEWTVDISQYSEWMYSFTVQAGLEFNDYGWVFEESGSFGEIGLRYDSEFQVGNGSGVVSAQATTNVFDGNKHRVACFVVENSEIGIAVDGVVEDTTSFGTVGPVSTTLHMGYHERLGNYSGLDADNPLIYTDSSQQTIDDDLALQPWT